MARRAVSLEISNRRWGGRAYRYYLLRWWDPRTGKRRSRSLGRVGEVSKREARQARDHAQADLDRQPLLRSPDAAPSLGEHIEDARRIKRRGGARPATIGEYERAGRLLGAFFGADRRVDRIRPSDARRFREALAGGELAPVLDQTRRNRQTTGRGSVEKYMATCRAVFELLLREDEPVIARNPFRGLVGARDRPASWRYVPLDEFWRLYGEAGPETAILLALARFAALSRSDAIALAWGRVDLEAGTITYERRKSGVPVRAPIAEELDGVLRGAHRPTLGADQRVVGPVSPNNLERSLARLRRRAGVAPYGQPLHALRKSCITDWASRFEMHVVHRWSGHTSAATTMRYYTAVRPEHERAARGPLAAPPESSTKRSTKGRGGAGRNGA